MDAIVLRGKSSSELFKADQPSLSDVMARLKPCCLRRFSFGMGVRCQNAVVPVSCPALQSLRRTSMQSHHLAFIGFWRIVSDEMMVIFLEFFVAATGLFSYPSRRINYVGIPKVERNMVYFPRMRDGTSTRRGESIWRGRLPARLVVRTSR